MCYFASGFHVIVVGLFFEQRTLLGPNADGRGTVEGASWNNAPLISVLMHYHSRPVRNVALVIMHLLLLSIVYLC